jgi:uncharacterized membrane protein
MEIISIFTGLVIGLVLGTFFHNIILDGVMKFYQNINKKEVKNESTK